MAMDVTWSNAEKTLMGVRIHGDVSWDQYHDMCKEALELLQSVPHRVDIIFTAEVDVPSGNPLPHFKRASVLLQSVGNLGYCISVVPINIPLARVFMSLIYRAYGISSKFQNVYNLQEAHQMIADARAQEARSS
jgi:hypothetical protein